MFKVCYNQAQEMFEALFFSFILIGITLVWVVILTYLFFQERDFLGRVFPKHGRGDHNETVTLRNQFSQVLESLEQFREREKVTAKHLQELRKEGLGFIQMVEVMRYNPYGDVGGDQSFSVLLLDGKKNGIMLTSLHSRSGTRIYVKPIKEGKSELELSVEERKLMGLALK